MSELVGQGSRYSDQDRREAVIQYAIHGSLQKVSDITGIPRTTLIGWKQHESGYWQTLLDEVRQQTEDEIEAFHTRIIKRASEEVLDRLEHGDYKLTKDGDTVRVPVAARDAATIGAISYDKRRLSLGLATNITDRSSTIDTLIKRFEEISQKHEKVVSEQ